MISMRNLEPSSTQILEYFELKAIEGSHEQWREE